MTQVYNNKAGCFFPPSAVSILCKALTKPHASLLCKMPRDNPHTGHAHTCRINSSTTQVALMTGRNQATWSLTLVFKSAMKSSIKILINYTQ